MAREISPICNFMFGSIHTGLLTDTVDVELTVWMVKGIYTYRKDYMAKSMVFSTWSRTVIPFPFLCKKIQAFQDENRQMSVRNKGRATSYFSVQPQPKCRHTLGKTRTRWSNWRNWFNPIKTEWYNVQDRDTIDFNKIDIVKPTPKWLCMWTLNECTYCKFNALHPSATCQTGPVRTGMVTKTRPESPLLDFKLLEQQIQKIQQDRAKDTPEDTTHNATADKQKTDLVNGIQDITLESKLDTQNLTDILAAPLDVPEVKCKGEDRTNKQTTTLTYDMTDQEIWLQQEEEKYGIYMSTFSYEGDNFDLDSKTDSDSILMAYLYLE